jgi:ATP-dependent helicase/DNAse subunit B
MTTKFKQDQKFLNLKPLEITINNLTQLSNPDLAADFSLAKVFAEAYSMAYRYQIPPEYICEQIAALEFPISDYDQDNQTLNNPFNLSASYLNYELPDDIYITGYIDWVGKVNYQNQELLAVIDYKSGKSDYEYTHLGYNPQLLFYALAYETITKQKVDVIGIHNLRSSNLVLTKIDRQIQAQVIKNFFAYTHLIQTEFYAKHLPESKYAPCLNSFNAVCSYIADCHPNFKVPIRKKYY